MAAISGFGRRVDMLGAALLLILALVGPACLAWRHLALNKLTNSCLHLEHSLISTVNALIRSARSSSLTVLIFSILGRP